MRSIISHSGLVAFIVEGARADSSRSLHLLRAIEDTVASNEVLANTFEAISRNAADVAYAICRAPVRHSRFDALPATQQAENALDHRLL